MLTVANTQTHSPPIKIIVITQVIMVSTLTFFMHSINTTGKTIKQTTVKIMARVVLTEIIYISHYAIYISILHAIYKYFN